MTKWLIFLPTFFTRFVCYQYGISEMKSESWPYHSEYCIKVEAHPQLLAKPFDKEILLCFSTWYIWYYWFLNGLL